MPKLKKKSDFQRKGQKKDLMRISREDETKNDILRELDRKSKFIKRKDDDVRQYHNTFNKLLQKKRLADNTERIKHNEHQKLCQMNRLTFLENREEHRKRESESQMKRLMDPVKRDEHRKRESESQKKRLIDPVKRDEERKRKSESQMKRLMDPVKRDEQRKRESESQMKRLMDPVKRDEQRKRESESQMKRLMDPVKRDEQRKRESESQKKRLMDPVKRDEERKRKSESQMKRLMDPVKRDEQRKRESESQMKRLMDPVKRDEQRKRESESQMKRLMDPVKRDEQRKRESESQKKRLMDPVKRDEERKRKSESQMKRLMDPVKRDEQRKRESESQMKRLMDPVKRDEQRKRESESQMKRLMDPVKRDEQRKRESESQMKRLMDPVKRDEQRKRESESQKKRLMDPVKRDEERKRKSESQMKRLMDPVKRDEQRKRESESQKKRLIDPVKRDEQRKRESESQKKRLMDRNKREVHNLRNKLCQQQRLNKPLLNIVHKCRVKRLQRSKLINKTDSREHLRRKRDTYNRRVFLSIQQERHNIFAKYNVAIKDGPFCSCVSCDRLMFRTSMSYCTVEMFNSKGIPLDFLKECCIKMVSKDVVGYLCSACKKSLYQKKIPRFSLYHTALRFPFVSDKVKKLTPLEERFLCPRIPFMQIRSFGGHQQYSVKGRVVNVPTDVAQNIDILPRLPNETDVVPVALKKKKIYTSSVIFQSVRPKVIIDALKSLENCAVFREANIQIDYNRIEELQQIQQAEGHIDDGNENDGDQGLADDNSDSDSEEEPDNVPAEETLLQSEAIVFAPGENFQPIPLFMDTHVEAMSFIKIYGGEIKEYPEKMSYQDVVKSEVMRSDRRVASSVDKLFFSSTYLRAQKISNSISICMRKSKGKPNETVGNVLSNDFLNSIIVHDSGYKVFAPDRGSPAFLELKKREVFAMLRQIGPPTFFITLSPAETKCPELLVILKKVVDDVIISEEEALNLEYQDKVRLIKQEPVTCAVYFDYKLRKLFSVLRAKNSIFREYELIDSYTRVEFQNRGSPHAHSLLWLKGAPHYKEGDQDSINDCENFVDNFVSCQIESEMVPSEHIQFQRHKHTFTCWKRKKNEKKCRFGIPMFPMHGTKILEPLGESVSESELKIHKQNLIKVRKLLDEMYKNEELMPIDEFLVRLNLSYDGYLMAIRSSLKRPKCFLKRSLKDIRINAYNPEMLMLHRSNMDIQFITDIYSCAMYVLNYINKSSGVVSKVLREAMKEVNKGDLTIKEKLRFLANKFLNASEFTAQEAVYYLLSLPLSICSRSCVFINTGPPEKRVSVLKSKRDLSKLPNTSTDIFKKSLIDHYENRPTELEGICLAEFAAYYSSSPSNLTNNVEENCEDVADIKVMSQSEPTSTKDGRVYHRRAKPKIIRHVRYNIESDENNYYREQLMLFKPWRNETDEIIEVNHKRMFNEFKDEILSNRSSFIYNDTGDDVPVDPIDQAVNDQTNEVDTDEETVNDNGPNEYEVLHDRGDDADIFVDVGIDVNKKTTDEICFPVPNLVNDEMFYKLVQSLNKKQKKYLLHILNCVKLNKTPIYECILGGAGVGKSRLIEAIQQTLLRYYNTKEGTDLESMKILICAPTGKAAYNIKGITLHSAFILPLNQFGFDMPPLSSSVSNTLLSKLNDLKLIIMDEVSMIGSKVFGQINMRLQQIFRSDKLFAGISIVMFGDFNQLAPVCDRYIFKPDPSNLYGDLVGNPLWNKFSFFELTEIMRQKDDKSFAVALNHLAQGTLTEDEVKMFNSRRNLKEPCEVLRLFRSNAEVDYYNESVFRERSDVILIDSIDKVVGKVAESVKTSLLKSVKQLKVTATYGLPQSLKLSIGVHYMLTNNISVIDGLVNGAVGLLKCVEKDASGNVKRLWLQFDDINVGKEARKSATNIVIAKKIDKLLTPIEFVIRNIRPRKNTVAIVMRKQFPLVPAEAITVYKSQGGTYTSAVVNLKPGMRRHELYVACSRVTSLIGLFIRGNFTPPKPCNDEVSIVIKKAIEEKPIHMTLRFLEEDIEQFSVCYHNVQSLRKHHADLISDHFQTCATIIALVETWTVSFDNVNIEGYEVVYRADVQRDQRHAYGLIVYCKSNIATSVEVLFEYNCEDKSKSCNMVLFKIQNTAICLAYKPPSTCLSTVKTELLNMLDSANSCTHNTIFLGDLNVNLFEKSCRPLTQVFEARGMQNMLVDQPSTNGMTQIDVCFSNMKNLSASYFESYYSYHKPIVCIVNKDSLNDIDTIIDNLITDNVLEIPLKKISDAMKIDDISNSPLPTKGKKACIANPTTKKHAKKEITDSSNDLQGTTNRILPIGFQNKDNVSCYCNVVCQCTFFIKPLCDALLDDSNNNSVTALANAYLNSNCKSLNSKDVRKYVDDTLDIVRFSECEQQDTAEFITSLYSCMPSLENVCKYRLIREFRCETCSSAHENIEDGNTVLRVFLTPRVHSLKRLIQNSYDECESIDMNCNNCGYSQSHISQTKVGLDSTCSILIVQLVLFVNNNGTMEKQYCMLSNLHDEIIIINCVEFKVSGIILHHGDSLDHGHYTCKLRKDNNTWILADDSKVTNCPYPRCEYDAYIVILERRMSRNSLDKGV